VTPNCAPMQRWHVRLTVRNGKVMHSGQREPVKVEKTKRGFLIGCTYVSNEALVLLSKTIKGEA
jgi:hypothetical protein